MLGIRDIAGGGVPSPPSMSVSRVTTAPYPSDEFVPPIHRRETALPLTIAFITLAWICTLFRLYTRIVIVKAAWWDDLLIFIAMLATTAGGIVFILLQNAGMGRHFIDLPLDDVQRFLKIFYVGSVTYPVALITIKLALLFQYLRIFDEASRRRRFCKWLIVFIGVWGAFFLAPSWVPCVPLASMWDFSKPPPRCWGFASDDSRQAIGFHISQGVTTTLLDLVVFFLPIRLLLRPRTQRKSRIALLLLFFLGVTVSLVSVVRLVYLLKFSPAEMRDLSWTQPMPTALAVVEISLASVCAALPVFWPVIENTWGMIFVRYEVQVKTESGVFVPRKERTRKQLEIMMQHQERAALERAAMGDNLSEVELARNDSGVSEESSRTGELRPPDGGERGGDDDDDAEKPGWDPYVGDPKTGMGESDTVVQSPADGPPRRGKHSCSIF
ncbi:hypothetical protein QBC39DRAFT_371811 [Podospora conica]|nr:hypothetical protein QBC39DRAFT_371811 [Schizothecium conicum]